MGKLDKIVKKYYKEYQLHMHIDYMEDYILDIKPVAEMKNALAETIKTNGKRYLFLNEQFAEDLLLDRGIEKWEIGVLFHEFTHIADDRILEMGGISETKKYIVRPYKEYHAEFIKTLYMFGIHQFPNNRIKIPHTEKIVSPYGYVSIYDYMINIKDGYVADIDVNKMDDMLAYMSYFDRLSYYLGTASVYRICCDYKLDEIMDISVFSDKLGKDAERLKEILLKSIDTRYDVKVANNCARVYIPLIQPFLNK